MGILDFKEIDRPNRNNKYGIKSDDLDAFEKFAEEFFEKILGAKILERIRRGQDNGLDLKVERKGETQLVSCKHYAHTDTSIGTSIEEKAFQATTSNGCDKFVGFYSTTPHESLIRDLEGCKNNPRYKFDYEILKSSDIESKLLDSDDVKGWILTARYFPKSFANLFRRFVVPIEHYKISDLKKVKGGWELNGPYGGSYCSNHEPENIVREANDALTSAMHLAFFKEALKDTINLFPKYFVYKSSGSAQELKLRDISPAWHENLDFNYSDDCNSPIIISALWTFWDSERALNKYRQFREDMNNGPLSEHMDNEVLPSILCLGTAAKFSNGVYRNLLSRMVAFMPAGFEKLTHFELCDVNSFEQLSGNWQFLKEDGLEWLSEGLTSFEELRR
ncbi:hypothetical protein KIJ96_05615 [Pseudoalteromonas piscicida]|uniref:restriction endonuclease n=1 Tax=Pseudoalteromonas piscicida TaxID=43662 RepID=UPI001D0A9C6E|nr:restriction endonuclease [Pseudoalteromonas piscicida]UDM62718.1 hypothetical protein KIJ96_05615 [Pseudoalteromonas piscicida]